MLRMRSQMALFFKGDSRAELRAGVQRTSLAPEKFPRIVLQVAKHLLDVVINFFIHDERADRAFAFFDVLHDRLSVGRRRIGA